MLVVVGPCSIHDPSGALDYAARLAKLRAELAEQMEIVMRVYFEKPRTTVAGKGLSMTRISTAVMRLTRACGSPAVVAGHHRAGFAGGDGVSGPIVPQYIADIVSWSAIGARTTESQTASRTRQRPSMPVGFKNSTDGSLQVAIDALGAARHAHNFLGVDEFGFTSIVRTTGNPGATSSCAAGGASRLRRGQHPRRRTAARQGRPAPGDHGGLQPRELRQRPARQEEVWRSVIEQRVGATRSLIGMMVESNLHEGTNPSQDP